MKKVLLSLLVVLILFSTTSVSAWCESATTSELKKQCNECIKQASCNTGNGTADNACKKGCEDNAGISHAATNIEEMQQYQGKYVQCGNSGAIPNALPKLTRMLVLLVQILVPVVLIIYGMIDFTKAVMVSDSDFLDKAKKKFIRRLISAIFVFFVLSIVKFVVGNLAADNGAMECASCFISSSSDCKAAEYKPYYDK